jgi:hypothetical protein
MIEQKIGDFTRRLVFKPGFCWVRDNPHRNFGNGSVQMSFFLVGPKGAVHWVLGTKWMPEAARKDVAMRRAIHGIQIDDERSQKPNGYDLGYHSPTPRYEDQNDRECDLLPGGRCYCGGSALAADELVEGFLNGGDEWVWNRLEAYYRHMFEGDDYPSFLPIIEPHPDDKTIAA